VAEGPVAELRGQGGLLVKAEPLERAAEVAASIAGVEGVEVEDGMLRLVVDPGRASEIARELVSAGVEVIELRPAQHSLEEAFFQLTEEKEVV